MANEKHAKADCPADDLPLPTTSKESAAGIIPIGQQFKYCPICATELVYRELFDRMRQQCPACDWIHFQDPKVGAGVIAERNGKVLLARRGVDPGKGLWCFPSGFVEIDESPAEAAVREYKEETGLDVELTCLFDVYHFHSAFKGTGVLILYRGNILEGTPTAMDDITEVAFYGADELPAGDQLAFTSNRKALKRWKAEKEAG